MNMFSSKMKKMFFVFVFCSPVLEAEVFGAANTATGTVAMAWGQFNDASGNYSTAWGYGSQAEGNHSTSWGFQTAARGTYSTSWGLYNSAFGAYTTAFGLRARAVGNASTAAGVYTEAQAVNSFAIGEYNSIFPDINSTVKDDFDPVFTIGNGSNVNNRSNALTVLRNGLTTINGNLVVSGLISSTSDFRLKSNVTAFESGEDIVMALEPVTYTYTDDEQQKPQIGFIAQDVEYLLPEVVGETREGFKTIDYSKLSAVLVDAVQSLKEENEQLKQALCEINARAGICQ